MKRVVGAPAHDVFASVAKIGNLPRYLPPVEEARKADPSGGPADERVWMRGEIPDCDPLVEGIDATLESIRRRIQEDAGKVGQPPVTDQALRPGRGRCYYWGFAWRVIRRET